MSVGDIINLILNGIVVLILFSIMFLLFCGWVHDSIYMPLRLFVRKIITKDPPIRWGEKYWY